VAEGQSRAKVIAGDVAFFIRVGTDGQAKVAYLEESTLGDRATERCLVGVVQSAAWPKPAGGDAEVRQSLHFDMATGARAPSEWSAEKVASAVDSARASLAACKRGASAKVVVTAYVEADGKNGKVRTAGAAAADKDVSERLDCFVDALKGVTLPSPGSYFAKVTFSL
jgi:hypothetical protein